MSHSVINRVAQLQDYDGIATRLCAVPVHGYRWSAGEAWTKVSPGWALGFFDDAKPVGFLLVADEIDTSRRHVVVDWATART